MQEKFSLWSVIYKISRIFLCYDIISTSSNEVKIFNISMEVISVKFKLHPSHSLFEIAHASEKDTCPAWIRHLSNKRSSTIHVLKWPCVLVPEFNIRISCHRQEETSLLSREPPRHLTNWPSESVISNRKRERTQLNVAPLGAKSLAASCSQFFNGNWILRLAITSPEGSFKGKLEKRQLRIFFNRGWSFRGRRTKKRESKTEINYRYARLQRKPRFASDLLAFLSANVAATRFFTKRNKTWKVFHVKRLFDKLNCLSVSLFLFFFFLKMKWNLSRYL